MRLQQSMKLIGTLVLEAHPIHYLLKRTQIPDLLILTQKLQVSHQEIRINFDIECQTLLAQVHSHLLSQYLQLLLPYN